MRTRAQVAALFLLAAAFVAAAHSIGQQQEGDPVVPAAPRWFKGNLHTHSLWSDGNDFPEMIVQWYVDEGYHFLTLSDHNVLSQGEKWINDGEAERRGAISGLDRYRARFGDSWVQTREMDGKTQVRLKPLDEFRSLFEERGKFILIQAEEITDRFESLPVHINASHLRDPIRPQGGASVRETIANNLAAVEIQEQQTGRSILAHLNHPNFNFGVTAEDLAAVVQERFFEVYNGHPSVGHLGDATHVGVERMWDIVNTLRIAEMHAAPVYGLATDDSHNYFGDRGASPGRGWVMVRASYLTPESLIAAIRQGDFYASSGVTLRDVRYDPAGRVLDVEIEATEGATYTTQFIGTAEDYDRKREPVLDGDGKPVAATQRYSDDVGRVFATVTGTTARYELTGKELYVRAVVTSSQAPINPSFEGQHQQAWTQPVVAGTLRVP